jgi:hypothetical protein
MDRRRFIAGAVAVVAAPLAAEAQQAGKVYRVGYLGNFPPTATTAPIIAESFVVCATTATSKA